MNRPYYKPSRRYDYTPNQKENPWPHILITGACGAAWMALLMIIAFT